MCGCATEHGGWTCGSSHCHCHDDQSAQSVYSSTAFTDAFEAAQAEEIYMTISFTPISRGKAAEILKIVTAAAGLTSYSVYINDEADEEDDDG